MNKLNYYVFQHFRLMPAFELFYVIGLNKPGSATLNWLEARFFFSKFVFGHLTDLSDIFPVI